MRTRTIAPGFWKSPQVARCDPLARLIFAALWGLADRAGRLKDEPDRIRAEAFPYEPHVDSDALLWQLHTQGLALRYCSATGLDLIEMPRFCHFQRPYTKEPASQLPGVAEDGSRLRAPKDPASNTELWRTRENSACLLSPVSCLPPPGGGGGRDVKQLTLDGIAAPLESAMRRTPTATVSAQIAGNCPHEILRRLWVETLPTLPAPAEPWGSTSAKHLRARWRDQAKAYEWRSVDEGLRWFRKLFAYVGRSRFLCGRVGPRPLSAAPFQCTLEWLVRLENWTKVVQGQYHDEGAQR